MLSSLALPREIGACDGENEGTVGSFRNRISETLYAIKACNEGLSTFSDRTTVCDTYCRPRHNYLSSLKTPNGKSFRLDMWAIVEQLDLMLISLRTPRPLNMPSSNSSPINTSLFRVKGIPATSPKTLKSCSLALLASKAPDRQLPAFVSIFCPQQLSQPVDPSLTR